MRRYLTVLAVALTLAFVFRAEAQDGHAQYHDTYKLWKTPSGGSCCNNQDCRPTQARYEPTLGVWRVLVDGVWCPVPASTRRPYASPDGRAHVCAQKQAKGYSPCGGIICFVPGAGG